LKYSQLRVRVVDVKLSDRLNVSSNVIVNAESPFGRPASNTYAGVVIDLIFSNCLPNVELPASIISPTDSRPLIVVATVFVVDSETPTPLAILTVADADPAVNEILVSAILIFAAYADD